MYPPFPKESVPMLKAVVLSLQIFVLWDLCGLNSTVFSFLKGCKSNTGLPVYTDC